MTEPSAPPTSPVRWGIRVSVDGVLTESHLSEPFQTAWKAATSVRLANGNQPHFSQCDCQIYEECVDMELGYDHQTTAGEAGC
jgi:hypothetical protein